MLKSKKAIMSICDVKKLKLNFSSISENLATLRLFFVENKTYSKIEIVLFAFLKEKITLKHLKNVKFFDFIFCL